MSDILVVIPAREAAQRLPGKPLADIHGSAMIVHVLRRAVEASVGPVVVATDSDAIREAVEADGGTAVMTRSDHESGSDRIFEVVERIDPDKDLEVVVNLQGDLPTLDPELVRRSVLCLRSGEADIATLVAEIKTEEERDNPNVVKAIGSPVEEGSLNHRALYFSRATAPFGDGPLFHHIGIYAYRREALARFVGLPQSPLEKREKLEQLRALENGMRIDFALVDTVPLGVDTPDDLERARALLGT